MVGMQCAERVRRFIEISIWFNPCEKDNRRMVITLFGDLRGYEESQHDDFISWLNKIIEDNTLWVRDGIITLNEKVYRYDDELENFVLICRRLTYVNRNNRQEEAVRTPQGTIWLRTTALGKPVLLLSSSTPSRSGLDGTTGTWTGS